MAGIFEFLKLLLAAFGNAFGFFKDKQQQDAGSAKVRANSAEDAVDAITKVDKARDAVRDSVRDIPDGASDASSLPDDGFRRD